LIFITAKFTVKPEHAERWPEISRSFTEATRAEPGCLWFDWSRSLDDPNEYVLVEAFRDGAAGGEHVQSEHFRAARAELPAYLASTPRIVNVQLEQQGWSELGEMAVER
jgi:quinol monooxygenase YgiN